MKQILGVIVALALTSVTVGAQAAWTSPVYNWGSGWCPTCYVFMNVDSPNLSTPFAGTIAGWGFECGSGQPLDRIDVYYSAAGVPLKRAKTYLVSTTGERPDVLAYFLQAGCPKVSSTTGWTVGFTTPIPSGTWTLSVVAWKGSVSTTQSGLVVVP